jgi:excisionase family DNA binding protein
MQDDSVLLVPVEEAARRLSIGRTTVFELIRRGELKAVKVGRSRRVPAAAIAEYASRLHSAA